MATHLHPISRDHYGRKTITEGVVPHCVFGGYRMAREDWTRTEGGWDCECDYEGLPSTVFATREECEAAIAGLHGEQKEAA